MEQRSALLLRKRGVQHLKGLGATYEIVRWRREKGTRCFFLGDPAHVAKPLIQATVSCRAFSGSIRASIRCLTRSNSGTAYSRSTTTPRRVRDSDISRAVTAFETRPVRAGGLRRPKQDGEIRIASDLPRFPQRNCRRTQHRPHKFTNPRLDVLSFELGGERA
jgi:hypothetical protein